MASNIDGQLSFDLAPPSSSALESDQLQPNSVLSLCAHREKKEDTERARHFSEIIKLANHLQRKA